MSLTWTRVLQPLLLRLGLRQADARQRRHRIDGGRKAGIIGPVLRSLDDVAPRPAALHRWRSARAGAGRDSTSPQTYTAGFEVERSVSSTRDAEARHGRRCRRRDRGRRHWRRGRRRSPRGRLLTLISLPSSSNTVRSRLLVLSTRFTLTPVCTSMPIRSLSLRTCADRVGVERRQQLRQHFEDGDLGAGPGIDMAELERDDAAADEDHARRQLAFAQHLVGGDHQLGAGNRQRPRLGAGGDDDVLRLERPPAGLDRVGADELRRGRGSARRRASCSVSASESGMPAIISFSRSISAAQSSEGLPTLMQWTCAWPISCSACAGGDQHLLRRAAAVGAGAAEVALLDHGDLQARPSASAR